MAITYDVWNTKVEEMPTIEVAGPPCLECVHWNPQPKFKNDEDELRQNGVILCHADKQFSDFHCYNGKFPT